MKSKLIISGGLKDTYRGSCNKLVPYPLPLPPQHSSTDSQNLPTPSPTIGNEMIFATHLKSFTILEVLVATRNFSPDYRLGEGGFGFIYKGWLNKETLIPAQPGPRMDVVVKALKPTCFQGHREWLSEITYLGRLDHPNLVKLLGFCCEGGNRLLVCEFMPQGSLENHLFRRSEQPLSWALRIKVAVEAAQGLAFLHASESKIIYGDFKSSNILLDMDYNAKLSDFGLAKAGPMGDLTHETTQVMETQGYTAPEYMATGRLRKKCDVYSFGIVLLELITGRRAIDNKRCGEERNLLEWVRSQLREAKKLCRIMDIKLEGRYSRKDAFVVATLALQCCHPEAKHRPHMSEALSILENIPSIRANRQPEMSSSKSKSNGDGPSSWSHGCHYGSQVPMGCKIHP
ncbi:putative protein kinase RLK-Pelle-RLCK-VIIa-2 family [Helianthus debilis subsp. tardiflorus]